MKKILKNTEKLDLDLFEAIGIIKGVSKSELLGKIRLFKNKIEAFKKEKHWSRDYLIEVFKEVLEEFTHIEKGKFLDDKM